MKPADHVLQFAQLPDNIPEYRITIQGNVQDANKFLRRMRVELSRFRRLIKERGLARKEFKMICHGMVYDSTTKTTTIILRKQLPDSRVSAAITKAISPLIDGRTIQ